MTATMIESRGRAALEIEQAELEALWAIDDLESEAIEAGRADVRPDNYSWEGLTPVERKAISEGLRAALKSLHARFEELDTDDIVDALVPAGDAIMAAVLALRPEAPDPFAGMPFGHAGDVPDDWPARLVTIAFTTTIR